MRTIIDVGPHAQEEEQAAQHVLPLRHPGHRFHAQRVQGEDRRRQGAGPNVAVIFLSSKSKSRLLAACRATLRRMVPRRPRAVNLAVQNMGKPGQRMPVVGVDVREDLDDALAVNPLRTVALA